ncbi:MAG: hypothetical protein ACYDA4_01570 [Ignavibacteriaceae bacterium]
MGILNKIDNISAGSDYNKASKAANSGNLLNINFARHLDLHDKVDFSPSLKYVNQINWKLKEFKHLVNDKLFLDFIVSNLEFQTTIDLANFQNLELLDYLVIKEIDNLKPKKKIITDISTYIGRTNYNQESLFIKFLSLNLFFQRMEDSNLTGDITVRDKFVLDNFVNDIINGIMKEFDLLNNQIFIFIDKLANLKLGVTEKSKKNHGDLLVIKKINISKID